ncbi:hypothetical protein [Aureimonas phyllosphaerae]|uniref:Uncharacterized protein n=1 Tax=Aureimonas phyllosphaerae TaxID=1166078 RepID=A0A7W6FUS8_9HYPH|nr:hypothetical protein [Aureimonas phyllosphaerae]MBB3936554.1 hypothetical protein [Aureimonas phyllosphaerae]MBB3960582.1 hypothetical protein [Aureimonas phyllosphaerae]SFF57884.1 hypothetical protein SAMN05216566_13511 [Aureimonas phyllosphaerae]
MTAINIVLQASRAIVMTDALFIDGRTGAPWFFREKCVAAPGTTMVVAARGDYRVPDLIAGELVHLYGDIDSLLADDGQAVCDLYSAWVASAGNHVFNAAVELHIVGWSADHNRPRGATLVFNGQWHVAEIGGEGVGSPLPDAHELARLNAIGSGPGVDWDCATFDPFRHGIPLMEAQRRMALPFRSGEPMTVHTVGGHILLTEITAHGVTQTVVHEWPDVEGEVIQPERFEMPAKAAATSPVGLNRQQRRAWERQHGKVAA